MIVTDDRVAAFVSSIVGHRFTPPFTCAGIEKGGEVVAGVVFTNFEGADIQVTVAGHRWTREFLSAIGRYVFGTLGCERMTAVTEQPSVVTIGERLGGQVEGCLRNHFGRGRDGYVIGILKDEYRW